MKNLTYDEVKMLSELTRAYLRNEEGIRGLFSLSSREENIRPAIEKRKKGKPINRTVLVATLEEQYAKYDSKIVKKNIRSLASENTYTITTGHQLNLFTGPLYFIYKIISAIKTAKHLNQTHPDLHFVPVYWMATEDHDFDEINHTYVNGSKIEWVSDQKGMVGEFSTDSVVDAVSSFCNTLGDTIQANEVIELIKKSYLNHSNLSEATRFLVHSLFEKHGLVILDANKKELKKEFSHIVKRELQDKVSYKCVSDTIKQFDLNHKTQVNPREINLFYAKPGFRKRILPTKEGYEINNTDLCFSEKEMLIELDKFPERFSPNVILRPVYQECILPNVMYIGGGAEVAYWLELKSTFDEFQVVYPIVQIRSSFLAISPKTLNTLAKLGGEIEDVYQPKSDFVKKFINSNNPLETKLENFREAFTKSLKSLEYSMKDYDPVLVKSLDVSKKGFEKSLSRLNKKVAGSVSRKNLISLMQINDVFEAVYPNGVYQERQVNFFEMYVKDGHRFLDLIIQETRPFCAGLKVVKL